MACRIPCLSADILKANASVPMLSSSSNKCCTARGSPVSSPPRPRERGENQITQLGPHQNHVVARPCDNASGKLGSWSSTRRFEVKS
jgi:hypothetical protein